MSQHYRSFPETKQQYRQIFAQTKGQLYQQLDDSRQEITCTVCENHPAQDLEAWIQPLPKACGYRNWQKSALDWLEHQLGKELLAKLQLIEAYKNTFSCHQCGVCCRLASSEHSYETLQHRAEAGDDFARQFTSIFLPFQSRQAAQAKFPDVVQAVLIEAGESANQKQVFFYHCPYIGEDNRCTIYGTDKRPDICASYPETPLSFVYEKCAWRPWKDETHIDTLTTHATLALAQELSERLKVALAS